MSAVDQAKRAYDDHCPLCGEGIDWLDGRHYRTREDAWCSKEWAWYDAARLTNSTRRTTREHR